jgi:hypothetical protein
MKKIRQPPYNPLDKLRLGESVAKALLERPVVPLPLKEPFLGAGVYALYYTGLFPPYKKIADETRNDKWARPIYVGKAVPAGARKGSYGLSEEPGDVLYRRLCEHGDSIEETTNLSILDFACRYLVVDDIWIPLGESLLISMYAPLWNQKIDGFGNHDPGKGRYNQQRSLWDVVHPGRAWAEKLQPNSRSLETVLGEIAAYLQEK